jgi:preprotein translocase subunit SecF
VYFDVETIKQFSLPLIVGVVAGTYSSIFIASNLWVSWREYKMARKLKKA